MRKFKGKERSRGDITARADDAFKSANYAEFMVDLKKEGRYKLDRILVILSYILITVAIAAVLIITKLFVAIAVLPILLWMAVFFTWPFMSRSYQYTVDAAEFKIVKVYGGKYENDYVNVKIKDFELIAPYNTEYSAKLPRDAKIISALSSDGADDKYFALYKADGKSVAVTFEATEQLLRALRYYNSTAVVMSETRR